MPRRLMGVKTILEERGLWVPGTKLEASRELVASQPDFAGEREWMTAVVEDSGHVIDFYPRFHCELNFIERLWAAAKRWTRADCDYTFNSLIAKVPIALDQIPLDSTYQTLRAGCVAVHDSLSSVSRDAALGAPGFVGAQEIFLPQDRA